MRLSRLTAQNTYEMQVIVTTGQGEVKRAPDRAWVAINAESRSKDPKEAQRINAAAMSAVMEKLKGMKLGTDAIRTTVLRAASGVRLRERTADAARIRGPQFDRGSCG